MGRSEPAAPSPPPLNDEAYRWRVLWITIFGSFIVPFNTGSVSVSIPTIARDLGLSLTEAVWVQNAFLLTVAILIMPAGRIADAIGRKRVYVFGLAVGGLGALIAALAPAGGVFFAGQVIGGIGSAAASATSGAIVTAAFPPHARGRALGIWTTSIYLGLAVGPLVGGWLTANVDWRSIFALAIIGGPLVGGAAALGLRRDVTGRGITLDWGGAGLQALTLILLITGLTRGPALGWSNPLVIALLSAATLSLGALIWHQIARERRGQLTLIPPRLFRERRGFAAGMATALLNYSAVNGTTFLTAAYLQVVRGLRPDEAGVILLAMPTMQTLFSPPAGWLSDRLGARTLASAGMACIALGLALLGFMPSTTTPLEMIPRLALIGLGIAFFSTPNFSAVMGEVPPNDLAFASAALGTARQVGQNLSLAGLSAVAAAGLPADVQAAIFARAALEPAAAALFAAGVRRAFLVAAAIAAVGIFTSLVRGGKPNPPASSH